MILLLLPLLLHSMQQNVIDYLVAFDFIGLTWSDLLLPIAYEMTSRSCQVFRVRGSLWESAELLGFQEELYANSTNIQIPYHPRMTY